MNKKTRNIVHIYLKQEDKHLYYVSMSTFFNHIEYEKVGVTDQAVKNFMSLNGTNIYENEKVLIEKDVTLHLDSKNRKIKPTNILSKK